MKASEWPCPFSGQPADEWHHMTGRGFDGDYLDRFLEIPLVRRQHNLEHQAWGPDIDDGVAGEHNVLRLRRAGHLLVRLGEYHAKGSVLLPAETVRQLGLLMHRTADDLEAPE